MFLSPLLLSALVLASAPIIIHLLNRRRFVRVEWAAMRVLRQTIRSNRKRVRLEQWLLLLLRTLAIVALIVAIARPVSSGTHLASLFSLNGRASRVIVVDDSLGMGTQVDGRSAYERTVEAVGALLAEIGGDDEVTVTLASNVGSPLVRNGRIDSPDAVVGQLQQHGSTSVGSAWGRTFEGVSTLLGEATYPVREVTIVTDLGRYGWSDEVGRIASGWAADDVKFRVMDVGRDSPGGLQVKSLKVKDPVVLVDTDTAVLAVISNTTGDLSTGETLTVRVDGVERSLDLPDIAAGESVTVPIELTFAESGQHRVHVELPGDALPDDGVGFLTVDVRAELDIVLIDGEPGINPFEGEVDFLALALSAGYSRVRLTTLIVSDWESSPLIGADLVVLANVDRLPSERVKELEELVSAGTGLIVFGGAAVSPELYNQQLFAAADGLLPGRLGEPIEVEEAGLVLGDVEGSPIAALGKLNPSALANVRPRMVLPVDVSESGGRVLARWNDADSSPAVVSKRLGDGTVMFVSVSADRDWSDWPTDPTYVLAMRSAAFEMAGRAGDDRNLIAGGVIRQSLDASRRPERVAVAVPGTAASSDTSPSAVLEEVDGVDPVAVFAETSAAGFYELSWTEPGASERKSGYAVSPEVADAAVGRIDEAELAGLLGPLKADIIAWSGAVDASTGAVELWRWAVVGMLLLLVGEMVLGSWIDRGRRGSGSRDGLRKGSAPRATEVAA